MVGSSTETARGLNRLIAAGAPREQVDTLRAVYSSEIQSVADRLPQAGDSRLHWSRAEDAWLLAQPCPHTQRPSEAVINMQPILRDLGDRLPCRIGSPAVGGEGAPGTGRSWIDPAAALGLRGGAIGATGGELAGVDAAGAIRGGREAPADGAAVAPNAHNDDDLDNDAENNAELDEEAVRLQRRPRTLLQASCGFAGGFAVGYLGGVWALLFMRGGQAGGPWFMIGCLVGVMVSVAFPVPYGVARSSAGDPVDPTVSLRLPPSLRGGGGSGDKPPPTMEPLPVVEFGAPAEPRAESPPQQQGSRRAGAGGIFDAPHASVQALLPGGLLGQAARVAMRFAWPHG